MRRFLCILLCLLLCVFPTLAEQEEPNYIHLYDQGYPMEKLCEAIGADLVYVEDGKRIEAQFHDSILEVLLAYQRENSLEPTGMFDPATLRCILGLAEPEYGNLLVWIPMHGGIKYHINADCSKMYEPRQMPVDCAKALDYGNCGKCKPNFELQRHGYTG